jgi:hypothetical protein
MSVYAGDSIGVLVGHLGHGEWECNSQFLEAPLFDRCPNMTRAPFAFVLGLPMTDRRQPASISMILFGL